MSYSHAALAGQANTLLQPMSDFALGPDMVNLDDTETVFTWTTANRAFFYPFVIQVPATFTKAVTKHNASGQNLDVGIYNEDGTSLLVSTGSTAITAVGTNQLTDITDTLLAPGRYWAAMVCDNTAASVFCAGVADITVSESMGCKEMATAFPLPSSVTFAAVTFTRIPSFGFMQGTNF